MRNTNIRLTATFLVGAMAALTLNAKPKHRHDVPDQDQISVQSHIQLAGAPITGFIATQHYNRSYVYAERGAGNPVTLIDVTDTAHPVIVSQIAMAAGSSALLSVAGTAALMGLITTGQGAASKEVVPQSVSIMDFSDPAQPKVTRTFEGITALEKVSNGAVILLANKEGVWVLKQHFALDPKVEEEYAKEVLYAH
jgi:hypothetical protein